MIEFKLIWRLKFNNTLVRKVLRDNLMNFFCAGAVEKANPFDLEERKHKLNKR